ncbi:MAG: glycosyltransferase family 2 protein, partial [Candidatus Dormibacteria bacterium]
MNLPGVSIVMTPKDRTPLLMNTLETIWVQEYPDLEIIVVEDRPTESSLEFFCKRKEIKYAARRLKIEGWMNPAPLLNHGLLQATKDIVIFQNAEVKYETITGIADLVMPIVKAKIDQEPVLSTSAIVQCLSKTGEFEQWFV